MSLGLFGLLWTVVREVSGTSTEHAEVVVEPPFALVSSQLPVLTKLVGQVRFGTGRGLVAGRLRRARGVGGAGGVAGLGLTRLGGVASGVGGLGSGRGRLALRCMRDLVLRSQ